jgi:hypothetical protein
MMKLVEYKHTPEPWQAIDLCGFDVHADGKLIAVVYPCGQQNAEIREANARRIVACVNAMAGIEDPQLFMRQDAEWTAQAEESIKLIGPFYESYKILRSAISAALNSGELPQQWIERMETDLAFSYTQIEHLI